MNPILRPFLLLFGLLWLSTCSRNVVEIVATDFKAEVNPQENLVFNFTKPIVGDSILNVWDTTRYVAFSPRVEGKYKWISPTQLVFSPIKGFAPSTDYEVKVGEAIARKMGKKTPVNRAQALKFHTPYLQLKSAAVFWTQDDRRTQQLRLNLNFNYPIQPKSLQNLLTAQIGEQAITALRILSTEPASVIEVVMEEGGVADFSDKQIKINVNAGVICAESNTKTTAPVTLTVQVPNRNQLRVESITAEYEKDRGQIRVRTSQSVALTQVIPNLKVEPKIIYDVVPTDDGFLIKGNFKSGNTYGVKLDNDMKGVLGASLGEDYEHTVTFGDKSASVSFAERRANYLTNQGSKNVAIRINNVPRVAVKVYKVYENNLIYFLKNTYIYDNMSEYSENRIEEYADIIEEREHDTKSLPIVNDYRVLNLDFDKLKTGSKGIFVVRVSSTENQWINTSRVISLSDIGLMVRETKEDLLVFTNALMTATPTAGLKVNLISQSNQVVATAQTDAQGIALFPNVKRKFPQAKVRLITAHSPTDFNYLYFNHSEIDKSSFETGGKYIDESGYQAFMYGERDLYRPGETMNFNVIVRNQQWQPVGNIPVIFKIKLPNGKDFVTQRGELDAQGSFAPSVKLPENTLTGTYHAYLYTSANVLLESMPVSVEEFMPDRIKVRLQLLERNQQTEYKGEYHHGDSVRVRINAVNLFGPPATGRPYQLNFSVMQKAFTSKNFADYHFGLVSNSGDIRNDEPEERIYANRTELLNKNTEGETDEKGQAYNAFYIPIEYAGMGLLEGEAFATVFDETGRSVSRRTSFEVFTQSVFLGIKEPEYYTNPNVNQTFQFIALNTKGLPTAANAKVRIVRNRWQTVLEKNAYGELQYISRKKSETVKEETILVSTAGGVYNFTPQQTGEYEVQIVQEGGKSHVSRRFYVYGYSFGDNPNFEVNKNGKIDIKLDKESYQLGEIAKILFTTPFNGRMLVTVEREKVLTHYYLEVKNKTASAVLPIKLEHLPNVYISATLIKPVSDGAVPLTVAHGYQSIATEDPNTRLTLSIDAVEKSESNQRQTIRVRTNRAESDIAVTLAVVDEGILQLKGYATPNPHTDFFAKRGLQVEAYNLYPQLFPEISLNRSSTGGDGFDGGTRGNPMVNKRVKLVRFWSGVLKTNAMGEVIHTIDIPQFSGSLRIMAVAYKNNAFGSAQKNITVADPLVVSTGLPRFLSPNDIVTVPVTVFNTTNANTMAQINVQATANLMVAGNNNQNIAIKANDENQVYFDLQARPVIDSAKVTVTVQAMGRTFKEVLDINIRPITGLVKQSGSGIVEGGRYQDLNFGNDFVPNTTRSRLFVSTSPLAQFANNLEYVVQYPYGCVEQITSSVFPQLYVQDLMKAISPEKQNTELLAGEIRENIQEGIMKLLANQTYSGGLSYWAGGYDSHVFGTAYAAHFLIEAQKAGYEVSQSALDQMLDFLRRKIDDRDTEDYDYRDDKNIRRKRAIVPKEVIYAVYVLTLAGKEDLSAMNYFRENEDQLALDSRYLLACAYMLLGDQTSYIGLLPATDTNGGFGSWEISENALSGSFHSPIRDEALALNAFVEADINNQRVPAMARHLSEQVRNAHYLNTQESAFTLLSLGKLAQKTAQNSQSVYGEVLLNGNSVAQGTNMMLRNNLSGNQIKIGGKGGGILYYSWQTQGLSATGKVKEEDNRLRVRKTFYDREGNVIKNNTFRQNDLVIVKVSIVAEPYFMNMENIVITDMLPAGLEIENPRLMATKTIPWIRTQDSPEHFDIKDDRINYFTSATGKTRNFYYLARAVTLGTFQMGPVSADAMYNGEYHSYYGAGTIKIVERKQSVN